MDKTVLSGRMGQSAIDFDLEASANAPDTPVFKENFREDLPVHETSDPEERLQQLTASDASALSRSLAVRLQTPDSSPGQEIAAEARALISPLVDSVLHDAQGQLDLSKVPAKNFEEFKQFLLDQVAVDGMAFNDWASERFHWVWDSYRRVLASPDFEPLLERLYAEYHPEAEVKAALPDAELKHRLRSFSKELISVSTDRFAGAHLDSKEGRDRIRSILSDEGYDAQLRTDLIRSISRAKAEEGDCKLFVHNIRELTSTVDVVLFSLNVHNIGMKAGDLEAATRQTLSILRTLDESDAFKKKRQNQYLEHPEKVDLLAGVTVEELQAHAALTEVFEDQLETKSDKSDPRSKLRSKLAGLWLMAADRAHWGSTDIVGSNETRAYLLQQSEQFLQKLYKVETAEQFQALSAEIRQFLKNPPPKADSALSLKIDGFLQEHLEIQTGLNDTIEDLVKGMGSAEREPFDALLKFTDEMWAAKEMGEAFHLERKAQAEDPQVLEAANQFIQGLEGAKRQLWYGYKQQGTVSRGLSQSAEAIGTEGAISKIRSGNAAIDEVIAEAQKAKTPEELKQAYAKLYEQLKDGGKLHQAFKAAEMDGTEQLIGLGQSMALTLAISAVTEGAGGVNVALKAISNAGKVSRAMKGVSTAAKVAKGFDQFKKVHKGLSLARSVQKTADAAKVLSAGEKAIKGFKLGAQISTAENLSAKLSGQLQTEPQTILEWAKASIATGASMALTAPLAEGAEAGHAAKPALKKLWQRYTKDLSQGALHLARDAVSEVVEEVVDAYVKANLDGNYQGLSWDEFRDIATLCIAGGGAEKGLSNAIIGGGKRALPKSNREAASIPAKAASKPNFAFNPLFAPMWATLGAGGLGSGNPYRAPLSIKLKDAAKDKPSTPEIDQALISLKSNHPNIRYGAISTLEGMEARETVNDLIEVMQNDPAPRLRLRAAIALGRLKAPDAVPTLIEALTKHPNEREKIHVAEALAHLGRSEGLDYLLEVLKHGLHSVERFNVIEALRKMRVQAAGPALLQFVREDRSVLRDHAILALAEIPWEAATSEILRIFRRDPSGRSQLHSAVALAKMGRQEPLLFLMRKAGSSKDSLAERSLAALGLAALGDPGAAPILRQILAEPKSVWDHGPYLVEEAIDAIAALQDREAIPDLESLLSHPVRSISQAARRALQRLCGAEYLNQIVSVEDRQELDWKFEDEWSVLSAHLGDWMQVSILTKMHDQALRVKYLFFAILAALFGRRNAQLPPASIDQGGERNSIQPLTRELHESPGAIVLDDDRDAKIRALLQRLAKPRDALERLAHLEPMVGDSPYRLRVADVAEQLVAMEAQEAIPELRRLAEDADADPWLRVSAAEAEAKLAGNSGEPSIRLLEKGNKDDGRLNAFAAPALIGWDVFAHGQPGLMSLLSIGLFAAPMAMGVFSDLAKRIEAALKESEKPDFIKSKGEARNPLPGGIFRIGKSRSLGIISPSPEPTHKVASVTEHEDGYRVELQNLQDPDTTALFAYTSQRPEFEEGDEVGIAGGGGGSIKEELEKTEDAKIFLKKSWSSQAKNHGDALLLTARLCVARRFGGDIPREKLAPGLRQRGDRSTLAHWIEGDDFKDPLFKSPMHPSAYHQVRLFLRTMDLQEELIEELIQAAFFEERGWPRVSSDKPLEILRLMTRQAVVGKVSGTEGFRISSSRFAHQAERKPPIKDWLSGSGVPHDSPQQARTLFGQIRTALIGSVDRLTIEHLIEQAVFEDRGWKLESTNPRDELLLMGRRAVAMKFGGSLPANMGPGLASHISKDKLNKWLQDGPAPYELIEKLLVNLDLDANLVRRAIEGASAYDRRLSAPDGPPALGLPSPELMSRGNFKSGGAERARPTGGIQPSLKVPKGLFRFGSSQALAVIAPSPYPSHEVVEIIQDGGEWRVGLQSLSDTVAPPVFATSSSRPAFAVGAKVGIAGGGGGSVKGQLEAMADAGPGSRKLRDYQIEAIDRVIAAIAEGKANGLIVLPTGTGKTFTFVEVARKILAEQILGKAKKVLLLVHRQELATQAEKAFEAVFGEGSVSIVNAGLNSREFGGQIVIAGVQTLASPDTLRRLKPEDYGVVIVDETHHIVASSWQTILTRLGLVNAQGQGTKVEDKFMLGVTATPDRSDDRHIGETFTGGLLFSRPMAWFVERGYLLRPKGVLVTTSAQLSQVKLNTLGEYDEDSLGDELSRDQVVNEVVAAYERLGSGKKAVGFAASVDHAKELAKAFNKGQARPRAGVISGDMDPEARKKILDQHRAGEIKVLWNFGVLTEGYDDASIEMVLITRPIRKARGLYAQMVGRGARPDPAHPEIKEFTVVDFTGNIIDHELDFDLAKFFGVNYLEANQEPLDVVAMSREFQEALKDPETIQAIKKEKLGAEASLGAQYLDIAMMQDQIRPLPELMRKILFTKYDEDYSRMAWDLRMSESKLSGYISGVLPSRELTVEKDFAGSESILGLSLREILSLWSESCQDLSLSHIAKLAQRISGEEPGLTLKALLGRLARAWERETLVVRKRDDIVALLRYHLWRVEQEGADIQEIEKLFDRHNSTPYSRSQAKKDVAILTKLASTVELGGEELFQWARSQGEIQALPELNFQGFIQACEDRGVYTEAMTLAARRQRHSRKRNDSQIQIARALEEYLASAPVPSASILDFFANRLNLPAQKVPAAWLAFLTSDAGEASREKLWQALAQAGVLPLPAIPRVTTVEFMRDHPDKYLEHLLKDLGMVRPAETARLMEEEFWGRVHVWEFENMYADWLKKLGMEEVEKEGELRPGEIDLPHYSKAEISDWAMKRLNTNPEIYAAWLKRKLKMEGFSPQNIEKVLAKKLDRVWSRLLEEFRRNKVEPYYEDLMARAAEVTGHPAEDLEAWMRASKDQKNGFFMVIPPRRPQSSAQQWMEVVNQGRNSFPRKATLTERQAKIKEAFIKAGLNIDEVLRAVAAWDPAKAQGIERTLIQILLEKERGAGFRRPK